MSAASCHTNRIVTRIVMPEPLSPFRRRLCSRSNAVRVAARLTATGEHVAVVATPEPLQPWRVVDVAEAASPCLPKLDRCA